MNAKIRIKMEAKKQSTDIASHTISDYFKTIYNIKKKQSYKFNLYFITLFCCNICKQNRVTKNK